MNESIPSHLILRVITPLKVIVDNEVQSVSLPGLDGDLGILPGHRPLIVALGSGPLSFRISGKEKKSLVRGGYAEVLPDRVLVFTEIGEDESDGINQG